MGARVDVIGSSSNAESSSNKPSDSIKSSTLDVMGARWANQIDHQTVKRA
jgi:hypothetical protein